jgi:hypothetical protein
MGDHFLDALNNFDFPQLEEQKFESVWQDGAPPRFSRLVDGQRSQSS